MTDAFVQKQNMVPGWVNLGPPHTMTQVCPCCRWWPGLCLLLMANSGKAELHQC